jgi:hypothetical protein
MHKDNDYGRLVGVLFIFIGLILALRGLIGLLCLLQR